MTPAGDCPSETLFQAANDARARAICHLQAAHDQLGETLARLRWRPGDLVELNNAALAHLDSVETGFRAMRTFTHFAHAGLVLQQRERAGVDAPAQPEAPDDPAPALTPASAERPSGGTDRETKLRSLSEAVIATAHEARGDLEVMATLAGDDAGADPWTLNSVLQDAEARCGRLRQILREQAEVATCNGSA